MSKLSWLLLIMSLGIVSAPGALAQPTLEIEPSRFEPGALVLMTISGFSPGGYDGTVNIDGEPVGEVFIPPGGALTFFWPMPADLEFGGHDVDICAACNQGDLEERTNSVRVIVETGELTGSEFNLQPWGIEVTQGVRGDFATRLPPGDSLVLPPEDVVHVANRRTIVRVYPWVEGGPDFDRVHNVRARLYVNANGDLLGPIAPLNPVVNTIRADATLEELRANLRRTWNFVLPAEAVFLSASETAGSFSLVVEINPEGSFQVDECDDCLEDNTAYLSGNEFRHVGRSNVTAMKFRPHLVEAEVEQPDGTVQLIQRPTLLQLQGALRSLYDVLPIADGLRGIRLLPWINVDWSGTAEGWNDDQDEFLIANFLPGGELRAAPPNDYYAFLYWGAAGCSGHAALFSPFLRSSACPKPSLVLAHELNHAIGAAHAGNGHGEAGGGGFDGNYPGGHGQVEPDSWGIDVYDLRLYPPTASNVEGTRHDYMSYGPDQWVSRYTWNLTAENLGSPEIDPGKRLLPFPLSTSPTSDILDFVAFRGLLDGNGHVDLQPFFATLAPTGYQGEGVYELEFHDADGQFLSSHLPQPVRMQDLEDPAYIFAEAIALPVGWQSMHLREGGEVLQSWQRSANPPSVQFTSPQQGFQWPNTGEVTITWAGDDQDGDPLTYRILALHDFEDELFTLASGLTEESFTLDRSLLPGGGQWSLIIEASDGFDRTYSQFVGGFVEPTAPRLMILEPADGSVHVMGDLPVLGLAADIQGAVTEDGPIWFLDGDYVGNGTSLVLEDVAPGSRELELVFYNAFQVEGRTSVQFQVVQGLATPQLESPADGETAVPRPVELRWEAVPGAISYRAQVATGPDFEAEQIVAEAGNLGQPTVDFDSGAPDQTFYWRVMAEHASQPSGWSAIWSFTTGEDATTVEDTPSRRPIELEIFPNPANPATTIAFELPRAGHVQLEVYDVAGRRVRILVSSHRDAGRHEVLWDGRDRDGSRVSSGVYMVRLKTPDQTQSRRALLLK
jgi:hypothetical protein